MRGAGFFPIGELLRRASPRLKAGRGRLLLATLVAAVILVSASCAGAAGRSIARGWAGGAVLDDTLFVGSMEGKIIALDAAGGVMLGNPVTLETQVPSGGFGCTPGGTAPVAVYGSPAVSGDLVYVGGYDGKVRALLFEGDGLRREPRWIYPREGSVGGAIIGSPVVAEGKVFFASSNGLVFALNAADGFKEDGWPFVAGGKIWSTPAVSNGTLYVGSFDRKLYALNTANGTQKWAFETQGTITSTPVVDGGLVMVGSFDRHVYAVDASTGEKVWQFPAEGEEENVPSGWFWATPVVKDNVLYAPNLDGKVYALDTATGRQVAVFDLGSPVSSAPVLAGDLLIVATSSSNRAKREGAVYALNTLNNRQTKLQELEENVYAPLFARGNTVYVHTMANNLYAIDVETGASQKFTLSTSE